MTEDQKEIYEQKWRNDVFKNSNILAKYALGFSTRGELIGEGSEVYQPPQSVWTDVIAFFFNNPIFIPLFFGSAVLTIIAARFAIQAEMTKRARSNILKRYGIDLRAPLEVVENTIKYFRGK